MQIEIGGECPKCGSGSTSIKIKDAKCRAECNDCGEVVVYDYNTGKFVEQIPVDKGRAE